MENETPRNPRDVYNSIAGDVDPDASVIQTGHQHADGEESKDSGAVYNSVGGSVRGNASVIQAGDIQGNISL